MKVLQTVQKNLALLLFVSSQQQSNNKTFTIHQKIGISLTTFGTCLIGVYFVHVANSKEEYMNSFFMLTIGIAMALSHVSMIVKNDEIFSTINISIEEAVNESEFK